MRQIIVNYTRNNSHKRLVIERDLPFSEEVLVAVLFLQAAGLVKLDNVLSIKEYLCA